MDRYNAAVDLLDGNLEAGRGDRVAIRTTDGVDLTYAEAARAANRAGGALQDLGVEIENRVLLGCWTGPSSRPRSSAPSSWGPSPCR